MERNQERCEVLVDRGPPAAEKVDHRQSTVGPDDDIARGEITMGRSDGQQIGQACRRLDRSVDELGQLSTRPFGEQEVAELPQGGGDVGRPLLASRKVGPGGRVVEQAEPFAGPLDKDLGRDRAPPGSGDS